MSEVYPLISVLVLCYNNQKYLYESLESIFSQSYPNLELLINDDGSLDFDGNALDAWVSKNKTSNITSVFINHSLLSSIRATSLVFDKLKNPASRQDFLYPRQICTAYVLDRYCQELCAKLFAGSGRMKLAGNRDVVKSRL